MRFSNASIPLPRADAHITASALVLERKVAESHSHSHMQPPSAHVQNTMKQRPSIFIEKAYASASYVTTGLVQSSQSPCFSEHQNYVKAASPRVARSCGRTRAQRCGGARASRLSRPGGGQARAAQRRRALDTRTHTRVGAFVRVC
eukprot:988496-Pleurochrysis_carterae.AAC.1